MLTLRDIIDEVQIGTRSGLRDELSAPDFANRVGRRWAHMHRWRYLDGGVFSFETVADQIDYQLPRDLGEFEKVFGETETYTVSERVRIVSWPEWHEAETRDYGTFYGNFLGAMKYDAVMNADGKKENLPILSLTPKPTQARALRLVYRRTWSPLSNDGDVANVPPWGEEAFLELTRLVALAFSAPSIDGNPDPIGAMVANFKRGASFADAKTADGMANPHVRRGVGAFSESMAIQRRGDYNGPQSTTQDLLAGL